jgi:hypothetical protein
MRFVGKIIVQEPCGSTGLSMWVQQVQYDAEQIYKHVSYTGKGHYQLVVEKRTFTLITKLGPPKESQ